MLKYLLFYMLTAHAICAKPLPPQAEVPSHIVIVTPQAQVHLEPAVKYDTATAFIQHLSPLARIGSPHEETIVYVPASAAAPIIPLESASVGRAGGNAQPQQQKTGAETKQFEQISQQIQQAIQTGTSMLGPQLTEAATAAAGAAAAAGQGLFPALFPPPSGAESKNDKAKPQKITYETPAATEVLLPTSARLYAITPAVSHVVDFVHSPVFVGPLSAIRTRSVQEGESAAAAPLLAIPLPEAQIPEALPLKEELNAPKENTKELPNQAEPEKKSEFGRFLEANALKEEQQEQSQQQQLDSKDEKKEMPKLQAPLESYIVAKQLADEPAAPAPAPQLKIVAPAVNAEAAVAPIVAPAVVPQVAAGVGEDVVVVPQVKVA